MTTTVEALNDTGITEELVQVDPGMLMIGANVRTDTRPDVRDFAHSIKTRGVLETITAYRDDENRLVVLRGQRRAVVAAEVGTPTGTVPVRVIAAPDGPDRIVDQMAENIHRATMHESEFLAGVEQLALAGVSAAQIAKRTAIKRTTIDAALAIVGSEATRERVATHELSLEAAAIFAEFEHDGKATEALNSALRRGQSLEHKAQELRDREVEAAALMAEIESLRAEGLPVLDPEQADQLNNSHRFDQLVGDNGEAVPEDQWPTITGAAVVLIEDWEYPEPQDTDTGVDLDNDDETVPDEVEPVRVFVPVWVCTDPEAAELHDLWTYRRTQAEAREAAKAEAEKETKRTERRQVIANNKAWRSSQTVRREWLARFVSRKTPPKGAEALIAEAVLSGRHSLSKAMEHRHPMLFTLLGVTTTPGYYGASQDVQNLLAKQHTPKAATVLTMNAVLAGWENTTGTHTWRNPTAWDGRILSALIEWGYEPSEVEKLLLPENTKNAEDSPGTPEEATTSASGDAANDDATSAAEPEVEGDDDSPDEGDAADDQPEAE